MKIAILSLVPDSGHTIILLHISKLLQDSGKTVKFFGPSETIAQCQQRNISFSAFEIERPLNYPQFLARLSRASIFWKEAIVNKLTYINYFQKVNYYAIRAIPDIFNFVAEFEPDAIFCDNHQVVTSCELIALKLNCPIIQNVAYGNYSLYQSPNHISNLSINTVSGFFLPLIKKILGKSLTEFYRIFKSTKFFYDEYINSFLCEYWNNYLNTDLTKLRKLTISSGTGILEKKYLSDKINIPDNIFQVGPIAYIPHNLISEDLSNWLSLNSKPVIYVSFGTMISGIFPFFSDIIKAATSEGFRILWTYQIKPWKDSLNSENLRWEKWVPELEVLNHDNVKIFISHCGAGSIREALWFNKPVIGIPILWDQFYNSWVIEQLCGIPTLHKDAITINSVKSRIQTALTMQEKFKKISTEFKNCEGSKLLIERINMFLNNQ